MPDSVPERLRRLVSRLLEKDPARRPASADEVAAALAGPPRRRSWFLVAAAVMLAATAVALVALWPRRHWQAQIRELPSYEENSDSPAFSPDGNQIAYMSDREERDRNRIYVAQLDGGAPPTGIGRTALRSKVALPSRSPRG